MKPFRLLFIALVLMVAVVTVISVSSARALGGATNYLPIALKAAIPTVTPTPTVTPSPTPNPEPTCNVFFDDFSNSNSGWPVGGNNDVEAEYINGEYSFRMKKAVTYLLRSPADTQQSYSVETDVRWNGPVGDSYGLIFGVSNNFEDFFLLQVNTEGRVFRVVRVFGNNDETVVPITESSAIRPGNEVNTIGATANGNQQSITINGSVVASFNKPHSGALSTGIVVGSNPDVPQVDARFDNYCVSSTSGRAGTILVGPASLETHAISLPPLPAWE